MTPFMLFQALILAFHSLHVCAHSLLMADLDTWLHRIHDHIQKHDNDKKLEPICEHYYTKSIDYFRYFVYYMIMVLPYGYSYVTQILFYFVSFHVLLMSVYSMEIMSFLLLLVGKKESFFTKENQIYYYEKAYNYRITYESTLTYFIKYVYEYIGDIVFDWKWDTVLDTTARTNMSTTGDM